VARAPAIDQHRAAPLEITPEARERLTPFRERTFRAMYDAAMADGGAEVIASAQVIFNQPIGGELDDTLDLVCWVDGNWDEVGVIRHRVIDRILALRPTWSKKELADYIHMIWFDALLLPEARRRNASA